MFCRCGRSNSGYTAARRIDGGEFDFNYEYWVCSRCKLPSRLVWENMTMKNVLASAVTVLSQGGGGDGRTILTWAMADGTKRQTMTFKAYPRKVGMDQGRNVCVELWHTLDRLIDDIRNPHQAPDIIEYDKAQANAYAAVIQLIMSPFYEDSTAVLRESMARWEARQAETEHESPGLAEAIWNPNTRFDGTAFSEESEARVRNIGASAVKKVEFDAQKITFIKHCLENGLQTAETLASMFGCSVDDVKGVVS